MSLAGRVAVNVSALVAGRLLNAATGVVAVAVAARYLSPSPYGALVSGIAFTSFVGSLTDLGITTIGAREIAKRPAERQRLLAAVFTISALLAIAAVAVGLGGVQLLYHGDAHALERKAVLLLLLPTVLLPFSATAGTYFISEQKNYLSMAASVLGSLTLLPLVIVGAELDWGFTGIACAYAANGLVYASAIGFFGLRRGVSMRPSLDRAMCTQLFKWALPLGIALSIGALYLRLDVILLSVMKSASEVGPYGLAFKVVDVLLVLPGYMMLTLLPELARRSKHRDRLGELIQKALSVTQTVIAPIVVLVILFAEEVVQILGGGAYPHAVPILRILMVGVAFSYVGTVFDQGLVALNRQRVVLAITAAGLALNAGLNVALIPAWGGVGSAVAYSISDAAWALLALRYFAREATVPRPVHVPGYLAATGVMASAGLIKLLPGMGEASPALVLTAGGVLGVVLYAGTLHLLKAVPEVVQESLVVPLWARLKPSASR